MQYYAALLSTRSLSAVANAFTRGGTGAGAVQPVTTELVIKNGGGNASNTRIAFIKFQGVSAGPATLRLYVTNEITESVSIRVHRCGDNWDPATLTFNTMPVALQEIAIIGQSIGAPIGYREISIVIPVNGTLSIRVECVQVTNQGYGIAAIASDYPPILIQ